MAIAEIEPDSPGRPEQGLHCAARHHDGQPGAEKTGVTCSYTTAHEVNLLPLKIDNVSWAACLLTCRWHSWG
jgi:type VI secretion system protein ImpG